ncbi:MAG: peptidoglycan bridge formation glycyltransferase FemA/FemB family protein [Roseiflexus sp.]|nr:peptidoglycan bridge formation glycyltransferase FemA/FemB family protein [Roseiflexus sp.]MCS7289783.1 peptidoglycan bridge formation glycyltransferase FemA/FemB family protein [Roseiflexus sp.]MDW8232502.1 peptidoglycan bridge formation glycyltransferase FemA/FemB family protein [Roseiflexaceae bacterium]
MQERVYTADDREAWEEALPARISVLGSVGYARIVQRQTGYPARLFTVASDEGRIVYPFFLRPVSNLPFARHYASYWDTITPEYTGPIGLGTVTPELQRAFIEGWRRFCQEQRIVAEFMHLHPSDRYTGLLCADDVRYDRDIVAVDLTLSEKALWQQSLEDQSRYNIRRAQREGVRVFMAQNTADVMECYHIYTKTMKRRRALERYFFSFEYFWSFYEELLEHSFFLMAECSNRVVAMALYLYDDAEMYDFLAGLDKDYQHCRASHAIIYAAIQWGQRHGKRRLILGGGYRPNDGIFQFKASFSPLRLRFSIYRRIHQPALYADLCQAWTEYYGCALPREAEYFPAYRMLPPPDAGQVRELGGQAST